MVLDYTVALVSTFTLACMCTMTETCMIAYLNYLRTWVSELKIHYPDARGSQNAINNTGLVNFFKDQLVTLPLPPWQITTSFGNIT